MKKDMHPGTHTSSDKNPKARQRFQKSKVTIWHGMTFSAWARMLLKNRLQVSPGKIPLAIIITLCAVGNSLLCLLEDLVYGRKIAKTRITAPPIFIIGHWRTGTTLLHELLSLDTNHTYPTSFESFIPNHFLISEWCLKPLLNMLTPAQRPMDNMQFDMDLPQEDEFALCNSGARSIYTGIAFPNRLLDYMDNIDLDTFTPNDVRYWERTFVHFLKKITLKRPKRIVLKSPTHTFHIKTLLKLFPEARFIHIVRNPYKLFSSTVKMYSSLVQEFNLQTPDLSDVHEYTYRMFTRMHKKFEETRALIPPSQFHELHYEELVKDPAREMHTLYTRLGLKNFESDLLPALNEYIAEKSDYKPNSYQMPADLKAEITHRWGDVIKKYGYTE